MTILTGILAAEVTEGPYKGWPLGAAITLSHGQETPARVKRRLLAANRLERIRLAHQARLISRLPDRVVLN